MLLLRLSAFSFFAQPDDRSLAAVVCARSDSFEYAPGAAADVRRRNNRTKIVKVGRAGKPEAIMPCRMLSCVHPQRIV